jgi:hypothetical protein
MKTGYLILTCLQEVMQKNTEVVAENYIRDQYKRAVQGKSLSELKAICPDMKVERVGQKRR